MSSNDSNGQSESIVVIIDEDGKHITFVKTFIPQPVRPRFSTGRRSNLWQMEYGNEQADNSD